MPTRDATYFDSWYRSRAVSPHDEWFGQLLQLPDGLRTNSSLTGPAFEEVFARLAVSSDDVLLDLGCGRGQLGLEIARRTGCHVLGVDFAPSAIEEARRHAAGLGMAHRAEYRVADLCDSGVRTGSVDAIVSIDAITFPRPMQPAFDEAARVLSPGGRLVATAWEPRVLKEAGVWAVRLADRLRDAGFVDVIVEERADWDAIERARWEAIAAAPTDGDEALAAAQTEAASVLAINPAERRRVVLDAVTPAG